MIAPQHIQQIGSEIAHRFRPERIILFGSYAYGDPNEDSDVDLLVVLPFKGRDADKAIEIGLSLGVTFPLDLIVSTPEHLRQRLQLGDFFLREIVERGQVLYDAAHAGVG